MTVICTDGKTIACDSRMCGAYTENINKLVKLKDGRIAGISGNFGLGLKLVRVLNGEITPEDFKKTWTPTPKDDDCELLLMGGGKFSHYESDNLEEIPCEPPIAIGSGAVVAIGALEAGKSPKQAAEIAIKRDEYCGGPVVTRKVPK